MSKPYWIALAGAAAVVAAASLVRPSVRDSTRSGVGPDVPEDEQTGYIGRHEQPGPRI